MSKIKCFKGSDIQQIDLFTKVFDPGCRALASLASLPAFLAFSRLFSPTTDSRIENWLDAAESAERASELNGNKH